jgi:outer membrane immunogenic protein
MKKIALACALGMVLCGNAAANDWMTNSGAPRDWSGSYFGLQGGGAWMNDSHATQGVAKSGAFDLDGGFGGWTSGYNWQNGAWVWGIESDTSLADISGQTGANCIPNCYGEVNWFSTIRGRIGYTHGMFLLYGTAGLAYGEVQSGFVGTGSIGEADEINAGLAIGGGLEMAFDENWSAKIEYLHINLGEGANPGGGISVVTDFSDINLVRVGVNRKFDLWGLLSGNK